MTNITCIRSCGSGTFTRHLHTAARDRQWIRTPIDQTLWQLAGPAISLTRAILISDQRVVLVASVRCLYTVGGAFLCKIDGAMLERWQFTAINI